MERHPGVYGCSSVSLLFKQGVRELRIHIYIHIYTIIIIVWSTGVGLIISLHYERFRYEKQSVLSYILLYANLRSEFSTIGDTIPFILCLIIDWIYHCLVLENINNVFRFKLKNILRRLLYRFFIFYISLFVPI